jgi:hypothetical protein
VTHATWTRLLTATCVALSTSAAQAQDLFNPLSWFGGTRSGSYAPAYSAGNYYGAANCANGRCATPVSGYGYPMNYGYQSGYGGAKGNCPGGVCPVPSTGVNSYRPLPGGNVPPTYGNVRPTSPRRTPIVFDDLDWEQPVAPRPAVRDPFYDRHVRPAGGYDRWDNSSPALRPSLNSRSNPFYP